MISAWAAPFAILSPAGPGARLSILSFHRVLTTPDLLFPEIPDAARFNLICSWLGRWFNVLPLDVAAQKLRDGSLPPRAAAITFDDGYADNHAVALPILRRHGLTSTFFVSTGFLDGGRMWNDTLIEAVRRTAGDSLDLRGLPIEALSSMPLRDLVQRRGAVEALIGAIKYLPSATRDEVVSQVALRADALLPDDLMMSSAQVRSLHLAGMQIGAHTVNHPILAHLDRNTAFAEIAGSKRALESLLDARIGLFAYPNGKPLVDYTDESVDIARSLGFDAAVSTSAGVSTRQTSPFELPRFTPWDRAGWRFGARLLANLRHPVTH